MKNVTRITFLMMRVLLNRIALVFGVILDHVLISPSIEIVVGQDTSENYMIEAHVIPFRENMARPAQNVAKIIASSISTLIRIWKMKIIYVTNVKEMVAGV